MQVKAQERKQNGELTPIILELDSAASSADNFHKYIMASFPNYQFARIVNASSELYSVYKNNGDDFIRFVYKTKSVGGDPDLKIASKQIITKQVISGQFLDMVKLYNLLFTSDLSIEDAQRQQQAVKVTTYKGQQYLVSFKKANDCPAGYWNLILNPL